MNTEPNTLGVIETPLPIIKSPSGSVMKALMKTEPTFQGFAEAYYSEVYKNVIKGWKQHTKYTLNITVPIGLITFTFCSKINGEWIIHKTQVGPAQNYSRLTVPPGIWASFRGEEEHNILMNIIDYLHEPDEALNVPLDDKHMPQAW